MVFAENILGRSELATSSEFFLLLMASKVLSEEGRVLNIENINIDEKLFHENGISSKLIDLLHEYQSRGYIIPNSDKKSFNLFDPEWDLTASGFGLELFKKVKGDLVWNPEFAYTKYPSELSEPLMRNETTLPLLFALIAKHLISCFDNNTTPVLHLQLEELTESIKYYIPLLLLTTYNHYISDVVEISWDIERIPGKVDVEWQTFYMYATDTGSTGEFSYAEKVQFMKDEDIQVGDIAVIYHRDKITPFMPMGYITDADIVKILNIGAEGITYEKYSLPRTKEQTIKQFSELPEDVRKLYADVLEHKVSTSKQTLRFNNLGINTHFSTVVTTASSKANQIVPEMFIITNIDKKTTTELYVTIDGETKEKKMTEVDAVYWLLSQYNVDFDKDRYCSKYMDNRAPLYDAVDSHTVEFTA